MSTPSTPSTPTLRHPLSYHTFQPFELAPLRSQLLAWYDEHRRKLPWRGDAPAEVEAGQQHAAQEAGAAFGAREKKARLQKQKAAAEAKKAPPLTAFFTKATPPNKQAATQEDTDASSSTDAAAASSSSATAAASSLPVPLVPASTSSSASAAEPSSTSPRTPVSAYAIWVSELMCQQTRVETVIPYFIRWMTRFPTVSSLASSSLDDVLSMWAGLGYYRRARFLHEGAQHVLTHFDGRMPATLEGLRSIKGIGAYTAGAIASIAFNQPTPLVDGNVIRVLSRVRAIEIDPKDRRVEPLFWNLAHTILHRERPGDFNQAIMELGATICTPIAPKCAECPVREMCLARREVLEQRRPCTLAKREGETEENKEDMKDDPVVADIEELVDPPPPPPPVSSSKSKTKSKSQPAADPFTPPDADCTWCLPRLTPPTAVTAYPTKGSKKPPLEQHVCILVLKRDGEVDQSAATPTPHEPLYLILRRPNHGLLAGQWELPACIVPADATSTVQLDHVLQMLSTQLQVPLTSLTSMLTPATPEFLGDLTHIFSHRMHQMKVFAASIQLDEKEGGGVWAAALQDRILDETAPTEEEEKKGKSQGSATKKNNKKNAARIVKKTKGKRKVDERSDEEQEEEEAEHEAESEESTASSVPRSYRWVPLSLLQQDHAMLGGSELGLSSGVRKVVQLLTTGGKTKRAPRSKPRSKEGNNKDSAPSRRQSKKDEEVEKGVTMEAKEEKTDSEALPLSSPSQVAAASSSTPSSSSSAVVPRDVIEISDDDSVMEVDQEEWKEEEEKAPPSSKRTRQKRATAAAASCTPPRSASTRRSTRQTNSKQAQASLHNFFS